MSYKLEVYRAMPNPAGKDRNINSPRPEQLVREYVDIRNVGTSPVRFSVMELHHTQFGRTCSEVTGSDRYWTDRSSSDSLPCGQILRVHTGSRDYQGSLSAADLGRDVHWRGFAGRGNFVLNNDCGDTITIVWTDERGQRLGDAASYASNPPEGVLLYRAGDRLIPATVPA